MQEVIELSSDDSVSSDDPKLASFRKGSKTNGNRNSWGNNESDSEFEFD